MKTRALYLDDDRVRALLRIMNPMTQIRFPVKLPHYNRLGVWEPTTFGGPNGGRTAAGETIPEQGAIWHTRSGDCLMSPYGPGDRFSVREAWCRISDVRTSDPGGNAPQRQVFYRADYQGDTLMHDDDPDERIKWRSSRVMPPTVSRVTLKVTGVRVERLQDISSSDAIVSGIDPFVTNDPELQGMWRDYSEEGMASRNPIGSYMTLWNLGASTNDWHTNSWVWVTEFKCTVAAGESSC
jgi:hypothetical protein